MLLIVYLLILFVFLIILIIVIINSMNIFRIEKFIVRAA